MDKEKVNETNSVELEKHKEFENEMVPIESRKSLWTMIIIMAGFATFSATIWTGADIASSFNIGMLILIAVVGNILLTAYIASLAYLGGETGLSTHSLNKKAFGSKGFYLPSTLALLAQLGWFGVGVMMFTAPIITVIENTTSISETALLTIQWTIILGSGALMISTAFLGVKALKWVSIIAVPLVLIFGVVMMIMASVGVNADSGWGTGSVTGDMSFTAAVGLVFATFVSGGTLAPDFVRWSKNGKHAAISVIIAFLVVSTSMLIFGGFAYYGTGASDLSDALYIMGLAPIAVIVLGANIWTTNDNGLYTQGLAASSMNGWDKKWNIIILGVVGTLLAPVFNNHFVPFLNLLNLMLPGIGTILIINGFWFKQDNSNSNVNWPSSAAWLTGLILGGLLQLLLPFILPLYIIGLTTISYITFHFIQLKLRSETIETKEEK